MSPAWSSTSTVGSAPDRPSANPIWPDEPSSTSRAHDGAFRGSGMEPSTSVHGSTFLTVIKRVADSVLSRAASSDAVWETSRQIVERSPTKVSFRSGLLAVVARTGATS